MLRASGNRDEVKLGRRRRHPKHIPYCLRIDVWKTCGHGRYPTLEAICPAGRVLGLRRDALRASTTARVDAHLLFSIVRFTPTGRTRDRSSSSSSSSSKSSHRAGHESSGENDVSSVQIPIQGFYRIVNRQSSPPTHVDRSGFILWGGRRRGGFLARVRRRKRGRNGRRDVPKRSGNR